MSNINKVGVPRFELGSKRPKRPSIGQTNPYALDSLPQPLPYELHSRRVQRFLPIRSNIPCVSAIEIKSSGSISVFLDSIVVVTE